MKRLMTALALLLLPLVAFAGALPDPQLTPGVKNPKVTQAISCLTRWGIDKRHVTEAMKRQVAVAYGIARASIVGAGKGACCEFDHLIPRELGGADDVKNLWPESWVGPWNAHMKDRLENRLHLLVCNGTISLKTAQMEIVSDWQRAYARYVK